MKKPVVSIIIPAYHAERFISRALVSIMEIMLGHLDADAEQKINTTSK